MMTESHGSLQKKTLSKTDPIGRWYFKLFALCLPIVLLVIVDVALRVVGLVPPEDPLAFYVKTYAENFSPFVETGEGYLTIKRDWINEKGNVVGTEGIRPWRHFLYPGFRPCRIAKQKPPNTVRIFVLGGSTTFGLFVGAEGAFSAIIEKKLRAVLKSTEIEVINLGCPGLASTRVASLLGSVLNLSPDLVIVYCGHNEMLKGDVETGPKLKLYNRPSNILMSISTIFRWIKYGMFSLSKSKECVVEEKVAALQAGKIPIYDPSMVPADQRSFPSETYLTTFVSNYSKNVQKMVLKAQSARVPILFILPISNLLMPPGISAHDPAFKHAEAFEALLKRALTSFQEERFTEAILDLDRAVELSPRHATARFIRGLTLIKIRRLDQAIGELQKACDLDLRMHRINSRLELAMIEAVEMASGHWIDLRPTFRKDISIDTANKLFFDHCHPTKYGHELIAEQIIPSIVKLLTTEL